MDMGLVSIVYCYALKLCMATNMRKVIIQIVPTVYTHQKVAVSLTMVGHARLWSDLP